MSNYQSKVRIYDVARDLGVSNREVMDYLKEHHNQTPKSHSSTIEPAVANKAVAHFKGGKPADGKDSAAKGTATVAEDEPERPRVSLIKRAQVKKENEPSAYEALRAATRAATPQQPPKPQQPVSSAPSQPHQQAQQQPMQGGQPQRQAGQQFQGPNGPTPIIKRVVQQAQPSAPSIRIISQPKPKDPRDISSPAGSGAARPAAGGGGGAPTPVSTVNFGPPKPKRGKKRHQRPQRDLDEGKLDALGRPTSGAQRESTPTVETIRIAEPITVAELAERLGMRDADLIKHLFMKGQIVTINQTLDVEFARGIARELEVEVEEEKEVDLSEAKTSVLENITARQEAAEKAAAGAELITRPPVISIMGHVDHGKTSLLDAIREKRTNITAGEAGGITQSIGAYAVDKDGKRLVFLDTPGHEAFTAMRMRGAKATDIAILVVAADDGVMPQTLEAISHARAANIPIVVAVNKIDKEGVDPDLVLTQLSEEGLTPEKWGGDTLCVEVSALEKLGIDDLLETLLLVSELQDLKAAPEAEHADGVIIEAKLDKRRGPLATALVQNGTLRVGDLILMGAVGGRVRALIDDNGERVEEAGPATPVEILGLPDVPDAGVMFQQFSDEKLFKQRLSAEKLRARERELQRRGKQPAMLAPSQEGEQAGKEPERQLYYVVIKADTQGSSEAIRGALEQLSTREIGLHVLHSGTGNVNEADVMLASTGEALVVAFNVSVEASAEELAENQGIEILKHDVIYHVTEDLERRLLGRLSPIYKEVESGKAEVRQLFSVGKNVIAGCMVTDGKIVRGGRAVVTRGRKNEEVFSGPLSQLKRFKDDVKEVNQGYECGISFDRYNALEIGDVITLYVQEEIERTSLAPPPAGSQTAAAAR